MFPGDIYLGAGDVGVRVLHKSGVTVCECGHRDINPGARRLPSGYLFLLLCLFFVTPVYFSNLSLSFSLSLSRIFSRVRSPLFFSLCLLHLFSLRLLVSCPYRGILEHSMVHPILHIMYPTTVFRLLPSLSLPPRLTGLLHPTGAHARIHRSAQH